MTNESNKALYRRLVEELFNRQNYAIVDEIFAPDFIEHEELPPEAPQGRDAVRWFTEVFKNAFPDFRVNVNDVLAEGDKVVARITMSGTQRGEFMGAPPSGRAFEMQVIDIIRVADGKVAEHWGVSDNLGMMQQLGLIPLPDEAGI